MPGSATQYDFAQTNDTMDMTFAGKRIGDCAAATT
jgi:hypothetical protein